MKTESDSSTKVFTICRGKIQSSGFCDTCGQQGAQTTASYCGRLIEVSAPSEKKNTILAWLGYWRDKMPSEAVTALQDILDGEWQPSEQKQEEILHRCCCGKDRECNCYSPKVEQKECESSPNGKHKSGEYIEGAKRCYFCGEAMLEKDVTKGAEEIFRKHFEEGMVVNNYENFKNSYPTLTKCILKAMQEYSSTQRQQARNEAIQECIDKVKEKIESVGRAKKRELEGTIPYWAGSLLEDEITLVKKELEKLKTP